MTKHAMGHRYGDKKYKPKPMESICLTRAEHKRVDAWLAKREIKTKWLNYEEVIK